MDNKVFNLLEKLYVEFSEFKQDISGKITKIEATLENDVKPDIKLALQGFVDLNENITVLESKLDKLSDKVEYHDIKIKVIEGGKRA